MINAEDEIYVEHKTSCTREEAAAKTIGWLQGSVRRKFIYLDDKGRISPDQFPTAHSLDGPLLEILAELREVGRWEFLDALENDADLEVIQEKEQAVAQWDELIEKAKAYLENFDDEIAKGESCALRLDRIATAKSGVDHYTNISVRDWERKQRDLPDIESESLTTIVHEPDIPLSEQPKTDFCAITTVPLDGPPHVDQKPSRQRFDALAAELDRILSKMENPSPSQVMAELRDRAGKPNTCITVNIGDGIQWERNNGNVATLTVEALTERISGWKKRRLKQG